MSYYHWIEAFHIISVIMWMAGMLYLPRLYVYHTEVRPGSECDNMLKVMERRLLRYIINPAMIFTFLFGIILISIKKVYFEIWFHIKAFSIIVMSVIHGLFAKYRKDFERNVNKKSHVYFRVLNEIVTLLIVVIVIMVVVRPF